MFIQPTPAGDFRYRMTVITTAPGALNELNETTPVSTAVLQIWCKITQISGTKRFINAQITADVTHEIRCRYTKLIGPTCQLTWNGNTYDLVDVDDLENQHIELRILAHQKKP